MEAHEVRNLDLEIEQAKQIIEMRDALVRLEKNSDFKKVIGEGFLRDYVLFNVAARARTEFRKSEALLQSNQFKIEAASELMEYFRNIHAHGAQKDYKLVEAMELKRQIDMEE